MLQKSVDYKVCVKYKKLLIKTEKLTTDDVSFCVLITNSAIIICKHFMQPYCYRKFVIIQHLHKSTGNLNKPTLTIITCKGR